MSHPFDDRDAADRAYDARIRRLRADEISRRTGRPADEILAGWDAEDAAFARRLSVWGRQADPDDATLGPHFRVTSEMRGETIHYVETDEAGAVVRQTSVPFFWTAGYEIHVDGLRYWWHPARRVESAMSDAERRAVVARIVAWARREQGVALVVRGDGEG
ncbi:hypothetical protein [Roseisolibacter sp. H3M3-2]|uniref:hypothetical protein n=1 Tax=Roseisolibacter sp. H3M3-2 TaxID=3031323 RepID=UPI0023DB79DA|nr:hypothetical protein [Roseisolibacter sp. H3M3-2]MDF1505288.1 hypothetical protein [Roseisolibacter sp. H3M3-2]